MSAIGSAIQCASGWGAAVDFLVEDESMLEVAQWVVANTPFDRLYVYGDDLPIHVSYGPNQDRQIVRMVPSKSGRLVPRVIAEEAFLQMGPDALQGISLHTSPLIRS